jgi:hypothetical protein
MPCFGFDLADQAVRSKLIITVMAFVVVVVVYDPINRVL